MTGEPTTIAAEILGRRYEFRTAPTLFSPRSVDRGTLALLGEAAIAPADEVIDLGCGYGVVGIVCASIVGIERVLMVDSDPLAVRLAGENAARNGLAGISAVVSDGFAQVDRSGFTLILCNPPYHTDFAVAKRFILKGFNRLAVGGRLMLVVKRRDWYEAKLKSVFGGVTVRERDGYVVLTARKKSAQRGPGQR